MVEVSSDSLVVFRGVAGLALQDGNLSNGEKRLLAKLANALRLENDEPRLVYDSILSGENLPKGREIGAAEKRLVYEQILESFLIHTEKTDDAIRLIAYLRRAFEIRDSEHRAILRSLDRQLEDIVHRTVIETFRYEMKESMEKVGEIFDRIRIQN